MTTQFRIGREVRLVTRPSGRVTVDDFAVVERPVPDPEPGQVVVRNRYFCVEPGLRLWIDDMFGLPMPLIPLGQPLIGRAVGEVVTSADDRLPPGRHVVHGLGWREYAVGDASAFTAVDPAALPSLSAHLAPGLTAYVGLELAELRSGDTVFVSSAAGAVGSLAGQMARLRGAGRVIGSAGSPAKVETLTTAMGYDAAFDYHDGPVVERLRTLAPDGIDVYFDNVGGAQLEAAIEVMNTGGRVVLCGALAGQGHGDQPPLRWNQPLIIAKRLRLQGFTVLDHSDLGPRYAEDFGRRLRAGEIRYTETIVDGIEHAPEAFCDALRGRYTGRVVIRLT